VVPLKLISLQKNWRELLVENGYVKLILILQAISILVLIIVLSNQSTVVTVAPPNFTKEIAVDKESGSNSYYEAWGLAISELMGNVNQGNVKFVKKSLSEYMSGNVYQEVALELEEQVAAIVDEGIRTSFIPMQVLTEKDSGKVFVTGNHTVSMMGIPDKKHIRTYEFQMNVVNYRPVVVAFNVYEMQARTKDVIAQMTQAQAQAQAQRDQQAAMQGNR